MENIRARINSLNELSKAIRNKDRSSAIHKCTDIYDAGIEECKKVLYNKKNPQEKEKKDEIITIKDVINAPRLFVDDKRGKRERNVGEDR